MVVSIQAGAGAPALLDHRDASKSVFEKIN
jgi:hypothetical protein